MLRVTLTFDEPERYEQPEGTLGVTFTERYRCGFCSTTSADDLELAEHAVREGDEVQSRVPHRPAAWTSGTRTGGTGCRPRTLVLRGDLLGRCRTRIGSSGAHWRALAMATVDLGGRCNSPLARSAGSVGAWEDAGNGGVGGDSVAGLRRGHTTARVRNDAAWPGSTWVSPGVGKLRREVERPTTQLPSGAWREVRPSYV